MTKEIDFYFDYSSPYAYLASTRIDAVAAKHGRRVRWRPFLLGAVYKATGYHPLEQPDKRAYFLHDLARSARLLNVPCAVPATFPENHLAASRATYWIADQDVGKGARFAKAAFAAYWAEGRPLADPAVVAEIAAREGFARESVLAALNDPKVKDRLRAETDAALALKIFGSPVTMVDGEPFWGSDRLDQVDRWLATGGW